MPESKAEQHSIVGYFEATTRDYANCEQMAKLAHQNKKSLGRVARCLLA